MPKRFILMLVPAVLLALSCQLVAGLGNTLQGSGNVVSEVRPVSGFDRISVCCGMHLLLTQGSSESLEITADDNLLPEIESTVTNGTLVMRYKDRFGGIRYEASRPVEVRVSVVQLSGIELSGGGWMQAGPLTADQISLDLSGASQARLGTLDAERLQIKVSGGGYLSIEQLQTTGAQANLSGGHHLEIATFSGQELDLESSGGGQIQIQGSVSNQEANLSGGTQYETGDLQSQTATIVMSGGGAGTVWVTESLTANLSGGARLVYYGRPTVNSDLSGGSELEPLGEK